jgi:hypothetical protein
MNFMEENNMVQGYCVRCKEKKDMKDSTIGKTARGGFMAKGLCSSCGGKMCAMMSQANAEAAIAAGEAKKGY